MVYCPCFLLYTKMQIFKNMVIIGYANFSCAGYSRKFFEAVNAKQIASNA